MREAKMRYQIIQEFNSNTALTPIRDLSRNPKLLIPLPILLLMLAACGGGGGGGGPRPAVTAPTSLDPDLLSGLLSTTTDENNADFSHELLLPAELEGVTLSLAASGEGNDNEFFVIDGNGYLVLSDDAVASQVFDHETTQTRTVSVTATNDTGDSLTENVVISINDIADEVPVFTSASNVSVVENSRGIIHQVAATPDIDRTGITYNIVENTFFEIDSDSGLLSLKSDAVLDYETARIHKVTVTATDASNSALKADQTITIHVNDVDENNVNQNPVFADDAPTSFDLAENLTSATFSAVTATDPEGGTVTYSLENAPTGFTINASGEISFNGTAYDYETLTSEQRTFTLTVKAEDSANNSATHGVTVTIIDIDETLPDFSAAPDSLNLAENAASATLGEVTAIFGTTLTYSLENAPAGFAIDSSTGEISFDIANGTNLTAYDYEALTDDQRTFTLTVKAEDSANKSATHNVDINITDVNEAPVFASNAPTSFDLTENVILAIFD